MGFEIQTERLFLRPLQLADATQTQRLFPQWEIVKFLNARVPWPYPYRLNRRRPATERVSGSATPPRSGPERSGGTLTLLVSVGLPGREVGRAALERLPLFKKSCAKRFQLSYPGGRTSKPATSFPSISFTNNGRATGKEFPLRQNCRVSLRSLQQRPAPHVA
jgi:hypothetical protein